jgi:hypothetical protein
LKSVERSKASGPFKYLASIRAAWERHQARQGTNAADPADLEITLAAPKYFTVGTVRDGRLTSQ